MFACLTLGWLTAACTQAPAADGARVAQIELEQQRRRHELDQIRAQITAAEQELALAQRRLEYARCQANNGEWRARATRVAAECAALQMRHAQCLAVGARGAADSSLFGAILGGLVAVATGGAAAPFVLGGAVVGRTAGDTSGQCGSVPACELRPEAVLAADLAARGHDALADCGARPPGSSAVCTVSALSSFHLRPRAVVASVGIEYPAGTALAVLESSTVRRRTEFLYLARVPAGEEGWVFLGRRELNAAHCPVWLEPPPPVPALTLPPVPHPEPPVRRY